MKKQQLIWNTEPAIEIEIQPARKASPLLQLAEARTRRRNVRFVLPSLPRRQLCLADQKILAARRAAQRSGELAFWQASGGDFLRGSLAAGFLRTYQARCQ